MSSQKFIPDPSPESDAVVRALKKLGKVHGYDACKKAFAEGVSELAKNHFSSYFGGLKESNEVHFRFFDGRCQERKCEWGCVPPCSDHVSVWEKNGEPYAFVSQPYELGGPALSDIYKFAEMHKMDVEICNRGAFYFPSSAFLVIYTQKEQRS
jgi:hypothetical protein